MSLRIVITSFGSFGDLNPYLGLGQALARRGHRPVLALPDAYGAHVRAAGLEHAPVRPDVDPSDRETIRRIMDPLRGAEFLIRQLLMPIVAQSYEDLAAISQGADLIASHPLTFAAPLVAEKQRVCWASSVLAPLGFFSRSDPPLMAAHPLMAALQRDWPRLYRTLLPTAKVATRHWSKPLHALRHQLGLAFGADPVHEGQYSPYLTLAMFSRHLAEPQPDWPANTAVTGAVSYDALHGDMPPSLERFLDSGPPPVVFTLGSSAVAARRAPTFFRESLAAIDALGVRAVLLVGQHDSHRPDIGARTHVHVADWAPHSALFPRAAAVVHQGGAGTLHTALASGRPMLVVPFAHDQGDNACRAERMGVARVLFPQRYDARGVQSALHDLLTDRRYALRAHEIGKQVRAERGAESACDALEALAARSASLH
ncbi:MAG: glycosyltransferase [Gemmatimonadota bacterium]